MSLKTKFRVKLFSGVPDDVEKNINNWMDSDSTIKVVKVHQPTSTESSRIAVLVEYTYEKETYGA